MFHQPSGINDALHSSGFNVNAQQILESGYFNFEELLVYFLKQYKDNI